MSVKSILVTGGARSGKSAFAEKLCKEKGGKIAYIATAQVLDDEMRSRVKLHQDRRPDSWDTFEASTEVGELLNVLVNRGLIKKRPLKDSGADVLSDTYFAQKNKGIYKTIIIDCLTVLTSNIFLSENIDWDNATTEQIESIKNKVFDEIDSLIDAVVSIQTRVILVTNELGMGIVPENAMARAYRDIAGWVNQRVADRVDEVYLVVSGIPMKIKG